MPNYCPKLEGAESVANVFELIFSGVIDVVCDSASSFCFEPVEHLEWLE